MRVMCWRKVVSTASSQFCGSDARLAAPIQIYGNSRSKNDEAEDAVRGIRNDRAGHDCRAGQDEKRRRVWMAGDAIQLCFGIDRRGLIAATKNKKGSGRQRERDEIDRDVIVENLL